MYSDAGSKTCLGLPGSRGNEELDAQYFADLGVDFLKYDNCYAPASDWIVDRYSAMRDALNKTGRPILFSMCNWGAGDPWDWAQKVRLLFKFVLSCHEHNIRKHNIRNIGLLPQLHAQKQVHKQSALTEVKCGCSSFLKASRTSTTCNTCGCNT